MHAHTRYKIEITGKEAEIYKVAKLLSDTFLGDTLHIQKDDDTIKIELNDSYSVVFKEDIVKLAKDMAKIGRDVTFRLTGVIDTSESAGEYMDFDITYDGYVLTLKFTDWYLDLDVRSYESYEEFLEDTEHEIEISKEYYEELLNKDDVVFLIGNNYTTVVEEVPFTDVEAIQI